MNDVEMRRRHSSSKYVFMDDLILKLHQRNDEINICQCHDYIALKCRANVESRIAWTDLEWYKFLQHFTCVWGGGGGKRLPSELSIVVI